MRLIFPGLLLAAMSVSARQAQPTAPAPVPLVLPNVPPETVVATINGEKLTAAQLKGILDSMEPQFQQNFQREPQAFMKQYAMLDFIAKKSEKAKLDEQEPARSRLKNARMQILVSAALESFGATVKILPDEQQKFYEANKDRYTQARIKAIYLPFSASAPPAAAGKEKPMTEAEARAKADGLVKQARGGTDFVKLVKENSKDAASTAKDGDFGTIRKSDNLPEPVKTAIFALKAGQISEPVRMANGFYIFRVEESGAQPYDSVKNDIYQEIRGKFVRDWLEAQTKESHITFENEAFFPAAAPKAAPPSLASPKAK
ncbi:MAG: peptidyl-prolyl cis-trans isomerase [Acidobacteria bacterium]|nr:peptidyl-prolyl cis-trans isomerase [Acidobacteriota bacterium]